jgi:hypothetical protein
MIRSMRRGLPVLVACWSPKGGSGTTVVSVVVALALARSSPTGALIVDLGGDVPAVLGVPDPAGTGLAEWLEAPSGVGADALNRLEIEVGRGLSLLPPGGTVVSGAAALRADALVDLLAGDARPVVADCGRAERSPGRDLALGATLSLCVLRPCYLALRRALAADLRPTGVVLVTEPGRALQPRDVEDVLGVPVWAEVPFDVNLARAVDAGLLAGRPPRSVERSLTRVLGEVA